MPSEDRRILFTNEEVYKSLYALSAKKGMKKPKPGRVVSITEDQEDDTKIYMAVENPADMEKAVQEFSREFLVAALLLFCKGCGIPIPKSASKKLMIKDGQVMLRILI